jgi:hypothetical protein
LQYQQDAEIQAKMSGFVARLSSFVSSYDVPLSPQIQSDSVPIRKKVGDSVFDEFKRVRSKVPKVKRDVLLASEFPHLIPILWLMVDRIR